VPRRVEDLAHRRVVLLLAVFLACSSVGCDALFLRMQFVPLEATSDRIWLERDGEEELRAVLPVLRQSVTYADRFQANRFLLSDGREGPTYFTTPGPTWGILSLLTLVDSRRLQGLADFDGRTYAVVREFGGMCLEDVVLHEKTHVYVGHSAGGREVEEGIVLAAGLLAKDAYFGGVRANAREVLKDLSDDRLRRLARGLGRWHPFSWGREAERRSSCAFSLVDLVRREGGVVSVGLMLDSLRRGDVTPLGAAARALALSQERLLDAWVALLRREYLDPCDPELWSPVRLSGDPGRRDKGTGTEKGHLDFEGLGRLALGELLTLAAERTIVLSERECEQLAGSAPLSPEAYLLLAKVHHDSGRLAAAREAWLMSWRLSGRPKDLAGRLPSGRRYAEQVRRAASDSGHQLPDELRPSRWALSARWCLIAGCPTLASLLLSTGPARNEAASFDVRVRAAVIRGDARGAEESAAEAMRRFPEEERFRYYLAWLLYRRDDASGAHALLADDGPWPEESEWSELRRALLSRLSGAEARQETVEPEVGPVD